MVWIAVFFETFERAGLKTFDQSICGITKTTVDVPDVLEMRSSENHINFKKSLNMVIDVLVGDNCHPFLFFFEVCTGVELNDIKSFPAVMAKTEKDLRSMKNFKNTGILRNLPQD